MLSACSEDPGGGGASFPCSPAITGARPSPRVPALRSPQQSPRVVRRTGAASHELRRDRRLSQRGSCAVLKRLCSGLREERGGGLGNA